jgi:protein O-mannosyl-transferase
MLFYILSARSKKFLYLSFGFGLFSLTLSEKAIVFPILIFGLEYVYKINKIINWKKLIPVTVIALAIGLGYVSKIPDRISSLESNFYQQHTFQNPLAYIPVSIASYFELIFWPNNLTLYHTELNFSQSEYVLKVIVFIVYLLSVGYLFFKNKSVFYWLLFFLVCLLPTLTPFGISWFVAERYVYLSSIGFFVVLGYVLSIFYKNPKYRSVVLGIFIIISIFLTARTIIRNRDWRSQDSLWISAAKASPSSHQNHNNLGDMYGRHGDLDRAENEFKKAIELQPNYADAYHNLANIYLQKGEIEKAIENYHKAVEINPGLWQSYSNLSGIYFQQENYLEAEKQINLAIKANPNVSMNYYNLAVTHYKLEKPNEVIPLLNKALDLDPENQQAKEFLNSL